MSHNISLIIISPCLNLKVVDTVMMNSDAVIIEAYGMGNIPSKNKDFLNLIKKAIDKGVIIVVTT